MYKAHIDGLWEFAGGDATIRAEVSVSGPERVLESTFDVTTAAASLVGATLSAVSEIVALDGGPVRAVAVDTEHCGVAFRSERFAKHDADTGSLWDPLAGHYETADGYVQFHTNFDHHRTAMLDALSLPHTAERADVEAIVRTLPKATVETMVGDHGGIAAAVRTLDEWEAHPHAIAASTGTPITTTTLSSARPKPLAVNRSRPLTNCRVLDLTRIIAGPVCTRTLAAFGADVLRIGADDLPVIPGALPDTTLGKRFTHLDLDSPKDRDRLLELATTADIVVTGFRPHALAGKGLTHDLLLEANPSLVLAELSAFGTTGPWGGRRGFDSITQSATGIVAEETIAFASTKPRPLPCQLLDHGGGFLLALGALRALADRHNHGGARLVEVSLLQTRRWLETLGRLDPTPLDTIADGAPTTFTAQRDSVYGPLVHATHPGQIEGIDASWELGPCLPGQDAAVWRSA